MFYQGETIKLTVAFDEAEGEEETGYDVVVRLVCAGIPSPSPSTSSSKVRRCTLVISPELWADDSGTTVLGYTHMRSVATAVSKRLVSSDDEATVNILITAPPIRAVDVLSLAAFLASSLSSPTDQSTDGPPASPPRSPLEEIPTSTSFFPDTGTEDESIPSSPTHHPESDTPSTSPAPAPSSLSSTPDPSAPPSSAVHFPPSPSQTHPNTPLAHLLAFNASLDTALDTASQAAEWGWRGAVSRSGMACVTPTLTPGGDTDVYVFLPGHRHGG